MDNPQVEKNRQLIADAHEKGLGATIGAYVKLSGPGWLQSAITLGGGSLAGALFLGILGGTHLLWLQLVAIIAGVIMLSAISYVTLSIKERPFQAINKHINPVLGWGWIIATMMANIIWCMPQFSLCYAALQKNLLGAETIADSVNSKLTISFVLLIAAAIVVFINTKQGVLAKVFDWFLRGLVGMVVFCFVSVVVLLTWKGHLNWGEIASGFVPDLSQWNNPAGETASVIDGLPDQWRTYWHTLVVSKQREVMIGAAATAVGINMTFLMPYTLLNRGWNRTFRGLSRFDLCTGMAIPYILVTSCVVIAAAARFHAQVDPEILSEDPAIMATAPTYKGVAGLLTPRLEEELGNLDRYSESELNQRIASVPADEKRVAASLVKRNAFDLSKSLAPLLGERRAQLAFGLGVFGMGFSSIIILMLINGFAVREMCNQPDSQSLHVVGCIIAGIAGALWPFIWTGDTQIYLAIIASSFGMMLLPIAYVTFFMMMNNRRLMGDQKPTGIPMLVWNVLMIISVLGAIVAATTAVLEKSSDPKGGLLVVAMAIGYIVLVIVGFVYMAIKRQLDKE